jgi:tRNA nucleotidyltransferase (CCA-adding enzyme)
VKDYVREYLKYLGQVDIMEKMAAYELPKLPVNGHQLMEFGIPKGKPLGKALDMLRAFWKKSRYTASTDELLEHVEHLRK